MADAARRHAASSLAPGSFAIRQPERSQMTRARGREVAYVSVGARQIPSLVLPTNKTHDQLRGLEPIHYAQPQP